MLPRSPPWRTRTETVPPSASRPPWKFRSLVNEIVAAEYSGVLSPDTFLQLRGGYWRGDTADLPVSPSDQVQLVDFTAFPATVSGGTFWDWSWEQYHDQGDAVVSHYADELLAGEQIDLVVLARYMQVLSEAFVAIFGDKIRRNGAEGVGAQAFAQRLRPASLAPEGSRTLCR